MIPAHSESDIGRTLPPDHSGADSDHHGLASNPPAANDATHAFPIPQWERYQILAFLGEGGMGRVFLAYDPRIHRQVAVKVVKERSPARARRLVEEARAQAAIRHDCICKIHEVGEERGVVFIVMEYLEGRTLAECHGTLTTREKLQVTMRIAEALHLAHEGGLLHRDIKPENIMVETGADGELKPYLMDFSLAHAVAQGPVPGGGSPGYIAPELLQAGSAPIDRRIDVYSLGVMLCRILIGTMPEPLQDALPRWQGTLSPDLEAILICCLQDDPARRFADAQAFASDLKRFLAEEPVASYPGGFFYWFGKKMRKHRGLFVAAALSLLAITGLAAEALRQRALSAERAQFARDNTARVEQIEALARQSAMAPAHDIRKDRLMLVKLADDLERQLGEARMLDQPHWQGTLGRARYACGDHSAARRLLDQAWVGGYRSPRVAWLRGLILGEDFRRQLHLADLMPEASARQARRDELVTQYRQPILALLGQAAGDPALPSGRFHEALVAYYEGNLAEALRLLEGVDVASWCYEAPELEGHVYRELYGQARFSDNRAEMQVNYDATLRAYGAALAIARSEPSLMVDIADLMYSKMNAALYGKGDTAPVFEEAQQVLADASRIDPDNDEVSLLQAGFYRAQAESMVNRGGDAGPFLAEAEVAVAKVTTGPFASRANKELGLILFLKAKIAMETGGSYSALLTAATAAYDRVSPQDRDYVYLNNLGLAWWKLVDANLEQGLDPREAEAPALRAFEEAVSLDPKRVEALVNLGRVTLDRASRAADPALDLRRAETTLVKARTQFPEHVGAHFYLAQAYCQLGEAVASNLEEAGAYFDQALVELEEAARIKPQLPHFPTEIGRLYRLKAMVAWQAGKDAQPWLDKGLSSFRQAMALAPQNSLIPNNLGTLLLDSARFRLALGRDAGRQASEADAAFERAHALDPGHPIPLVNRALVQLLQAEYQLYRHRDPSDYHQRALGFIHQALALNPRHFEARLARHRLHLQAALLAFTSGGDPMPKLDQALQFLFQFPDADRHSAHWRLAAAETYLWKARLLSAAGKPGDDAISAAKSSLEPMRGFVDAFDAPLLRAELEALLPATSSPASAAATRWVAARALRAKVLSR